MNELDCAIDYDKLQEEMEGEDVLDYIEKEKGVSEIIEGLPSNQDEQDNRSL